MHIDKISDIIAHFIGIFEASTDEARLRIDYTQGQHLNDRDDLTVFDEKRAPDGVSDTDLQDYEPGIQYRFGHYEFHGGRAHSAHAFEEGIHRLGHHGSHHFGAHHFHVPGRGAMSGEQSELVLFTGPGSVIAHASQITLLQDDDYLNMTDSQNTFRDTSSITLRTAEFWNEATQFTPLSNHLRTDSYEGLQSIAKETHDYIGSARDNDVSSVGTGAQQDFVLAGNSINGTYINGTLVAERPDVDDFMPDHGIAKPPEEPEGQEGPLHSHDEFGNTLDVAAGANVVANVVAITNTGVMSPVTAVMGDYHQIDTITQAYVYSDRDQIDPAFSIREDHAATVANNIASFQRTVWGNSAEDADADHSAASTIFPTAWRVSYIEGDVSFVHWIEQYHFVSDNDTLTVTTSGADVSVLTGGNSAVNLASFLGIGMQYDLVIVGGNVLDMNMIAQISVLYDNDHVKALQGTPSGAVVQTGDNLVWNEATIHNVGANDRFAPMPDYIVDTVKAIDNRDPHMPEGLSTDPNFAGYAGLNVLYITGNLYDVTYIKQVSVLGDSDDVTQAASKVLANNENATVHIDTGSNAVVNIASIIDYDSFGGSTYVGGHLYSDAVLIQGGIVDHDPVDTQHADGKLANEVIAFLDDEHPTDHTADTTINGGHDLSWSQAHPVDVMQTAVA